MSNKVFFLTTLLILSISGYSQQIENCTLNKKLTFKLIKKKGVQVDTTIIKTEGVYILQDTILDIDKKPKLRYTFYRFFNNGKVYLSCSYFNFPNNTDLNNLHHGIYGEYVVNGQEVCIETYSSYSGYFYKYLHSNGVTILEKYYAKRRRNLVIEKKINPHKYYFINAN